MLQGQIDLGLPATFGQLLLGLVKILLRRVGLLLGRSVVSLLAGFARLAHLARGAADLSAGLFRPQPHQLTRQPTGFIFQLLLFFGQPLQLSLALFGIWIGRRFFHFFAQAFLTFAQIAELAFCLAKFLDQTIQFALATVLQYVEHVLQRAADVSLRAGRLRNLIAPDLAGGAAHGAGNAFFSGQVRGVGDTVGRQRVVLAQRTDGAFHFLQGFLESSGQFRLAAGELL